MNADRRNGVVALVVAIGTVVINSVAPLVRTEVQIPLALVCGLIAGYVLASMLV